MTGASQGIGRAVALKLAGEGVRVVLVARSGDKLESLAIEIRARGDEAEVEECDMSSQGIVVTTVQKVMRKRNLNVQDSLCRLSKLMVFLILWFIVRAVSTYRDSVTETTTAGRRWSASTSWGHSPS